MLSVVWDCVKLQPRGRALGWAPGSHGDGGAGIEAVCEPSWLPAAAEAAQTPDMGRVSQGCPQHTGDSQRSCSLEAVSTSL